MIGVPSVEARIRMVRPRDDRILDPVVGRVTGADLVEHSRLSTWVSVPLTSVLCRSVVMADEGCRVAPPV